MLAFTLQTKRLQTLWLVDKNVSQDVWQLASFLLVPTTVLTRVVWPCLGDGNKLRQLFTNLLSSSLFSPLQDHSLFEQYMPQNWMCHICWKCPPEKPSFPLFGWKRGKGHATLFSFQPSPARLIKPGFTKNWEFWRPMWIWKKTDVYLREKPRGGFYRRQVIDFPEWVSIKLSQTAVHSGKKSTKRQCTAVEKSQPLQCKGGEKSVKVSQCADSETPAAL